MRILVTGSAGYIGTAVCKLLIEKGHTVQGVDDFSNPLSRPNEFTIAHHAGYMGEILAEFRPNVLIHLAAKSRPDDSFAMPEWYLGENVTVVQRIAEWAREFDIERVVFASTANIYQPADQPIKEESPIQPNSPYGESKLIGERILSWYAQIYGFTAVALRFFNVVGGTHYSNHHLIPSILAAKAQERPFYIYGNDYQTEDGTCIRDFVHVLDVAQAHVKALELPGGAYNVGTGQGNSVMDVVLAMGVDWEFKGRRQGDPDYLVCDSSKLQSFGWQPTNSSLPNIVKDVL